jgi:hypothetical protein
VKYLLLLSLSVFCSSSYGETKQCYSPMDALKEYKHLFSGQVSLYRYSNKAGVKTIGWKLRDLKPSNILNEYKLKNGDVISHLCGVSFDTISRNSSDTPKCCNKKYPDTLTIRVSRSLIETFELEIPKVVHK